MPAWLSVILVSVMLNDVVFAILNAPPVVPARLLLNVESVMLKDVILFSSMLIAPPASPAVLSDNSVSSIIIWMFVHPSSILIAPPPKYLALFRLILLSVNHKLTFLQLPLMLTAPPYVTAVLLVKLVLMMFMLMSSQ